MRRPLVVVFLVLASAALVGAPTSAKKNCAFDPVYGGVQCHVSGTTDGALVQVAVPGRPGTTPQQVPPRRYLQTGFDITVGDCWVWSRTPPGLDAWDNANDAAIIATRLALPQCPARPPTPAVLSTSEVAGRAWEVFRSFELAAPVIRMEPPDTGITGLETYLSADAVVPLTHGEALPGGRRLEVEARMAAVSIDWGDGAVTTHGPGALVPYPAGTATHVY